MTTWAAYDCRRTTRSCRGGRARAGRRDVPATLAAVLDPANLNRVWMGMAAKNGQAPGVDGLRLGHLSAGERHQLFRDVRGAVLNDAFRPQPLREVNIPKPDGGTRTLKLAVVGDRVVSKAVTDALTPLAEKLYLKCSYGFRPKLDRFHLLADLKAYCERHNRWVITADDVRKAFDFVPVQKAIDALRQLEHQGADPRLIALAATLVTGFEPKEVGIPQGDSLSPITLNLVLHSALDTPMTATRGGHDPVRYVRYADNLVVLTRTADEGRTELERMRTLLAEVGLTLKGAPGVPRDLAQGEHLDLLGVRLTRSGDTLTFAVPDHKWTDLQTKLVEAHRESDPTGAARSIVLGWIQAHAPALINTDRRTHDETADRLIDLLRITGHDHVLTHTEIIRVMRTAGERWEEVVSEARIRMTTELTTPSTTTGSTAHSSAVTPDEGHQETDGHTAESPQDAPAQLQTGGASRDGPVGVSGSTTTSSLSASQSTTTSSSGTPSRPSGRSTALPGRAAAPPSAKRRRPRSSTAIPTLSQHRQPRHRFGHRLMPARPPPRPP